MASCHEQSGYKIVSETNINQYNEHIIYIIPAYTPIQKAYRVAVCTYMLYIANNACNTFSIIMIITDYVIEPHQQHIYDILTMLYNNDIPTDINSNRIHANR